MAARLMFPERRYARYVWFWVVGTNGGGSMMQLVW